MKANRRKFGGFLMGTTLLASLLYRGAAPAHAQPPQRSFSKNDRMVMTYFFVWYNWPNPSLPTAEHIINPNGTDALTIHPSPQTLWYDARSPYRRRAAPDVSGAPLLSYMNPGWFVSGLATMNSNDIDVVAVDFWGFPGPDAPPRSRTALEVLNRAMDYMDSTGQAYPSVAMFLDNPGQPTDLRTEIGAQWLFSLVRDFYSRINSRRVATFEGRVPVVFYAAGIDGWTVAPYGLRRCKELFKTWSGRELCYFGDSGWQSQAPGQINYSCHWGSAVRPTRLVDSTDLMEISPGYNYLGNTGANNTPPSPGAYQAAWEAARRTGRNWIAIETFNEFHESTAIDRTIEGGDQLLRITQSQARRFKNRQ